MTDATILATNESLPDEYPATPEGLSEAAAALNADMIWQRLEAYIAHRYTARAVEWIVEGPGDWQPPLKPATIETVDHWTGETWEAATLSPSPLGGYCLPGVGPYRFSGTAGADEADIPAAVMEAFRRVAEYCAVPEDDENKPGARSQSIAVNEVATETWERSASWMAQALQNSGAADLLRNYRRA